MLKFLCLVMFLAAGSVVPAHAQWPRAAADKKWEFSFYSGVSSLASDNFTVPIDGGGTKLVGLDFASGYLMGARIGELRGQHFGFELEYTFANQPGAFIDLRPGLARLDLDQRIHKIAYSLIFYPLSRESWIRPYVSAGVGASYFQLTRDTVNVGLEQGLDLRQQWKGAVSYGAGSKFLLFEDWGVRLDFRDHITGVPSYGLPSQAPLIQEVPGAAFRPSGVLHNWQVGVGIFYQFSVR